jgi:hypothetical protein
MEERKDGKQAGAQKENNMATTLEIVRGIHQAAANAYDGSHDERFVDGEDMAKKIGLRREEGCAIKDSRIIDGFNVKMMGNKLTITYHTEYTAKQSHNDKIVDDIEQAVADCIKFLKKEFKKLTGSALSLSDKSEVSIRMEPISRIRVSTQAYQSFTIGNVDSEAVLEPSEDRLENTIKDFLAQGREKAKKPSNYTAKNEG